MSNNKQTAVEWLIEHFKNLQREGEKMSWKQIIDITELAKEMEKKRMKSMYVEGSFAKMRYYDGLEYIDAETYYNETYGGNK
jgi:cysteinyl-tRNA synthetase